MCDRCRHGGRGRAFSRFQPKSLVKVPRPRVGVRRSYTTEKESGSSRANQSASVSAQPTGYTNASCRRSTCWPPQASWRLLRPRLRRALSSALRPTATIRLRLRLRRGRRRRSRLCTHSCPIALRVGPRRAAHQRPNAARALAAAFCPFVTAQTCVLTVQVHWESKASESNNSNAEHCKARTNGGWNERRVQRVFPSRATPVRASEAALPVLQRERSGSSQHSTDDTSSAVRGHAP